MEATIFNKCWIAVCLSVIANASVLAASLFEVAEFGSNPGNLRMYKYIPATLQLSAPVVVALHGCMQSASNFDDETGWTQFAEQWGFALLLPEQQEANNSRLCFNWFQPDNTTRDQGEPLSIYQMIDKIRTRHAIDPERIYVMGLSAGGAMAAVMLAAYPEVFAGGAIIAGIPYHCASSLLSALWCQWWGRDLAPREWGDQVRQATQNADLDKKRWPKVSIWQGTNDYWVRWVNARELMEQWTDVHRLDQQPDVEDVVNGYPHKAYKDDQGDTLVETYIITSMSHGLPIDPGPGQEQCGSAADYILAVGICSSYYIAKFWGLDK